MHLSRDLTRWIHFFFDQCLPPVLRDRKWFMWLPFKVLFRDKANIFFTFKDLAPFLSSTQLREIYHSAGKAFIRRETDLNSKSIALIGKYVVGNRVLDIACGRGLLAKRLAKEYLVTAADFVIDPLMAKKYPHIAFCETNIQQLPFADKSFDTVICTHTLEHVQLPIAAMSELRRVCAQRLVIVVPRQRPYRYTFDLHLHFFPYEQDLLAFMGETEKSRNYEVVGGDWFYVEG